jgi:hypothetical protein
MIAPDQKDYVIPVIYDAFKKLTGKPFVENAEHFQLLTEVAAFYNEYPVEIERLESFINKYSNDLISVLGNENFPQLRNPSIIILFYWLVRYEWRLRRNWWRSERELKLIYTVFGYSWGNY